MRRRRWIWLTVAAAVAVALSVFWWMRPRPCQGTFEQIRTGMTLDEVVATLGGPPGNYRSVPVPRAHTGGWPERFEQWDADDGVFSVRFDEAGTVEDTKFSPATERPTTWDVTCYRVRVIAYRVGWN
jgi:hypothetical protein